VARHDVRWQPRRKPQQIFDEHLDTRFSGCVLWNWRCKLGAYRVDAEPFSLEAREPIRRSVWELSLSVALGNVMIEVTSVDAKTNGVGRIGSQPIALAGAALVIIMLGVGSIAVWRTYTGTSPEQDRIAAARQSQARVAQTSEQLVEKTKGLEASQEESIDQLQIVQDQLQTVKRLLASQQTDTKRLSDQVGELSGAIDSLRQSFASIPSAEASNSRPARHASTRTRSRPTRVVHRKTGKSHG
jgi:uncharacterized protein YoxC